jgi:hypothetical protein
MFKVLFFMSVLMNATTSFATLSEIEKQCALMYKKRWPSAKIKQICFCVTSNIHERFDKKNIELLTAIYSRRSGRHEASKNDAMKALVEFDYFAHSNCQKDSLWKFPKDDLGRPDGIQD